MNIYNLIAHSLTKKRNIAIIPVTSRSMMPAIKEGDRILGISPESTFLGIKLLHLRLNDIVVFDDPEATGQSLIKRVAGLSGAQVTLKNGITVLRAGPGQFIALGDNLSESFDSRTFGPLPLSCIRYIAIGMQTKGVKFSRLFNGFLAPKHLITNALVAGIESPQTPEGCTAFA